MALAFGSPAYNNADAALSPPADQRGVARPLGAGYDLGAWEGPFVPALQIVRSNSTTQIIRVVGENGRSYKLLASPALGGGWTPVATNIAAGGFVEFPVPMSPPVRFFRIGTE